MVYFALLRRWLLPGHKYRWPVRRSGAGPIPSLSHPPAERRSRALAIPAATEAGALGPVAVEAVVPGLDFCNHSTSPSCRWSADEAHVRIYIFFYYSCYRVIFHV